MELWKDIAGYEGCYQISSEGRYKSLCKNVTDKDGKRIRFYKEGIRKIQVNNMGYPIAQLCVGQQRKKFLISRLVATAFIANPENKSDVNHKDCNPLNNNVENLEWVTHAENMRYAAAIGNLNKKGESHHNSRLTVQQVLAIRNDNSNQHEIAAKFGVTRSHISDIKNRRRWAHV